MLHASALKVSAVLWRIKAVMGTMCLIQQSCRWGVLCLRDQEVTKITTAAPILLFLCNDSDF